MAEGADVPLYTTTYTTRAFSGGSGTWTGPSTVASISNDNRVALMAIPIVDDRNGEPLLFGTDGSVDDMRNSMFAILEALGFPR